MEPQKIINSDVTTKVHENCLCIRMNMIIDTTVQTHVMPMISYYTPWKHQKTRAFLMFSGGKERKQWHKMGQLIS